MISNPNSIHQKTTIGVELKNILARSAPTNAPWIEKITKLPKSSRINTFKYCFTVLIIAYTTESDVKAKEHILPDR